MTGQRILRNTAALVLSQPLTWALTLVFTVLVPRNVGPVEWGEWTIAASVGMITSVIFDLGVGTVLIKGMARFPNDSERTLGAMVGLRLLLSPVVVASMVGFSFLAGYTAHTRVIVAVVAFAIAIQFVASSAVGGLQAIEKMHVNALSSVLTALMLTVGAFVMLKWLALGVTSIAACAVATQLVALVLTTAWLNRTVRVRPVLDADLVIQLLKEGLPYWTTAGLVTLYMYVDGVMISLLGATREIGWYGIAMQILSVPGFLIGAVTKAVLPALSRSMVEAGEVNADVVGRSFRLVMTLSLPMAVGVALVSTNVVASLYGAWFGPAASLLVVLAASTPAVYIATLVNTCLVAADRQLAWAKVIAAMTVLNVTINLFAIPYFHIHYGDGALGASLTLLLTEAISAVIALILLPPNLRSATRAALPNIGLAFAATALMAVAVWPLRNLPLPIPVATGGVVFGTVALLLRVFPRDEINVVLGFVRRVLPAWRSSVAPPSRSAGEGLRVGLVPPVALEADDAGTEVA